MTEIMNLANAILIIGCLYFIYNFGFNIWLLLLIIWCLALWGYHGFSSERKELFKAEIDFLKAKENYYRRKK